MVQKIVDTLFTTLKSIEQLAYPRAKILPGIDRIIQLDGYSCGARSVEAVLRYYGIQRSSRTTQRKLLTITGGNLTSVAKTSLGALPSKYVLEQNYPNPFNPSTTIQFSHPLRSRVVLKVFDILGRLVADLVDAELPAGWNQVVWNANVSSGLYFYRFEAVSVSDPNKRFVDVKRMILLK